MNQKETIEMNKKASKHPLHSKPYLVIEPSHSWSKIDLNELWDSRSLIWVFVRRDLKTRYRQQALGPLWMLLNPFYNMVVSSIIFGTIAKLPSEGMPYPIFLYTGMLTWNFFTIVYGASMNSLGGFVNWMQKIYFPRLVAPIVSIILGLVDWVIQISILLLLILFYHIPLRIEILTVPFFLIIALIIGTSVGLWASAISIKFRDFPNIIGYGIMAWYYATPVLYSATLIPSKWGWLYQLNPMFWVVEGMRWAILGIGNSPNLLMVIPVLFFSALFILSIHIFLRTSRNIIDYQ